MVCLGCGSLSVIFESFLPYYGLLASLVLPAFGVVLRELDCCELLAIVDVAYYYAVFELVVWAAVAGRLRGELLAPSSLLREFLPPRCLRAARSS